MSFWLNNPLKLFEDINVIPNDRQPYDQRMNTLTRLIILLSIVLYMFKFKGSLDFLIFGIIIIIIIYYSSQRNEMSSTQRESFAHTSLGKVYYDVKNGPGNPSYHKIPVEPPSPALASEWGGYHSAIDRVQDKIVPAGYSHEIQWGPHALNGVSQVLPGVQLRGAPTNAVTPLPDIPTRSHNRVSHNTISDMTPRHAPMHAPSHARQNIGQHGMYGGGNSNAAPLPFNLDVVGEDERFRNGNSHYIHRVTPVSASSNIHIPQPLNRGGGLESNPEVRDTVNSGVYDNGPVPSWSPEYVHSAKTSYQRGLYWDDNGRTGQHRSASTIGMAGSYNPLADGMGDGYRNINQLPGNNQYYTTDQGPFDGMFTMNTSAVHSDFIAGNGTVIPTYGRHGVKVEDYIEYLGDRQLADEMYYRDSFTEAAAAKIASTEYQYRVPMRHR